MALPQHLRKILNMLEDVIAEDQVKASILERKAFAQPDCEKDPALVAQLTNRLPSNACSQGRDVESNN
jgi:hypothetical protein